MGNTMSSMFGQPQPQQRPLQGTEGMPNVTPKLILDQQLSQLQGQFGQREKELQRQLKSGMYDQAGFVKELQTMQKDFDEQYYAIQGKQSQLKTLGAMANSGIITQGQHNEMGYGKVVTNDDADTMFSPERREPLPFSPKAMEDQLDTIKDYAKAARREDSKWYKKKNRSWYTPGFMEGETRNRPEMINQYDRWREYIGYESYPNGKQNQLDKLWDSHMKSNDMYDWDPKDERVGARRAKGRMGKALSARYGRTPTNPFDIIPPVPGAIRDEVDKGQPAEVLMTEVATGRRGMVPAADVKDFEANGYTR